MSNINSKTMDVLGVFIFLGLSVLGYFISHSVIKSKELERSVVVKGLAQKQFQADLVLWPIKFVVSNNNLKSVHEELDKNKKIILDFLKQNNISDDEVTVGLPAIMDNFARDYSTRDVQFRYLANVSINIYSKDVKKVRKAINKISNLSKKGIIFKFNDYDTRIEYIFTKLNEIKPSMIETATKNAREVALKFAKDSKSKLGKIKKARQGQFSITNRDKNTPYIKTVRVVSTVEYYLDD